ncbi:MAG: hypothetical protein JNL82_14540 [Myxococcales bacterium]|nr:hypothetical protein [Myxococcales bacterium]
MYRIVFTSLATLVLALGSLDCDRPHEVINVADDLEPRWSVDPPVIDMEAVADTPQPAVDVVECLWPDIIGGDDTTTIKYSAGPGGDDDQKLLTITIQTRAHEDCDGCVRHLLLKLGGEVIGP